MRVTATIWPLRFILFVTAILLLPSTAATAAQQGPEELRGKVTAVTGDRIHISLSQREWLPRADIPIELGAEMAGMFVPLKGKFVIIQVNADSCVAKAIGKEGHGKPAAGMVAVVKTQYPNQPQSRSAYMGGEPSQRQNEKAVLQMAEGGNKTVQNMIAGSCRFRGDHDNALKWWERASNGARERSIISTSATGRAKILYSRSEFRKALAILQDAASRTRPRPDEMVFAAYNDAASGIEWHVRVLEELGCIYRSYIENTDESKRWFRAATEVMAACATNGVPEPGQDMQYRRYQGLLSDLVSLYMSAIEDKEAAVPWLQLSARTGDRYAQKTLTDMGKTW